MSENLNRGIRDFSKFDTMETEKLEEILRLDAEAPEGEESDTELLLYVMGVLTDRRRNNKQITGKTALEAWESFQEHYLPDEEPKSTSKKRSNRTAIPWLRRMIAAAAVIALVVFIPVTAKALSWEDVWEVFARWAKETFSFVSGEDTEMSDPSPDDQDKYASIQELLEEHNIDKKLVPTWIPDGYRLEKIEKDITPIQEIYRVLYLRNDQKLEVRVYSYLHNDPEKIEINEDLIEIYSHSDVEYYIFSNMGQNRAIWIRDSYECYISGALTIDEIKLMIDSIEKG